MMTMKKDTGNVDNQREKDRGILAGGERREGGGHIIGRERVCRGRATEIRGHSSVT